MTDLSQFTVMPLAALRPSPDNPRKHIDQEARADLAANIREHGIISPIVVRPIVDDEPGSARYEIVSGERRWRASKLAELAEVPVRVLQLSDAAALEIQVIENLQRSDIHELEEADGYKSLQERYGYTVEDLAAKVGKSTAYIYGRLKLCSLVDQNAREAFFTRTIAPTVALFIARLSPQQQSEAILTVLRGGPWDGETGQPRPCTTRQALRILRSTYNLSLSDAPFSTESESLIPAAGPCTTCPKRTGNAPTLFEVETPDVCTDSACYRAKKSRHFELKIEDAKAAGYEVIKGKKAKEIFPYGGDQPVTGYVRLDAREITENFKTGRTKQERPWKDRLGKHCPTPTLVVHPTSQDLVEVITAAQLREAKKAAGIKSAGDEMDAEAAAGSSGGAHDSAARRKEREREAAKERERQERAEIVAKAAIDRVCEVIEERTGEGSQFTTRFFDEHLKKPLVFLLASHRYGRRFLVEAGALTAAGDEDDYDRAVAKAVEPFHPSRLLAILVRATMYDRMRDGGLNYLGEYSDSLKALVGLYSDVVSLKTLEKQATNDRIKAAAMAEEAKKADAAIAAAKPKRKAKAPAVPAATAMEAAMKAAKPARTKAKGKGAKA